MAETMGYIVICVILQLLPRTLTNVFCSSERLKREQRGTEGSGETGYGRTGVLVKACRTGPQRSGSKE